MAEIGYSTVAEIGISEYTEKKSVFIGHAFPIKSEKDALDAISGVRKKHPDARHNVYAFLIGNGTVARSNDDGEPSGTGGVPVLEVIRKSGITDVCIVVTRYFGGILLGAGGLVRAYSAAAKAAIEKAGIVTYEPYTEMILQCSYSEYGKFVQELERVKALIDDTEYSENVLVKFAIKQCFANTLCERVRELSSGKIKVNTIGTRFDFR